MDRLAQFLYLLMRDDLPVGRIPQLIEQMVDPIGSEHLDVKVRDYSNKSAAIVDTINFTNRELIALADRYADQILRG